MENEAIERAKRHLGKGGYLELENPDGTVDKFQINQLTIEDEIKLWQIIRSVKEPTLPVITQLDKENMDLVKYLGYESIKNSPDFAGLSELEKYGFIEANIAPLFDAIILVNDFGLTKVKGSREAIERAKSIARLREQRERAKSDDTTQ